MYAGIDIGGTNIKAVLTGREGNILAHGQVPTPGTADGINEAILGLIGMLAEKHDVPMRALRAIGIGAAGSIDGKKGVIIMSPNIQAWKNYPLARIIERKTGIRVFLENDATAAIMGEWWIGHGRKFRNWIMLTLGTGIGGGAIIDNKIYTGQSGSSMEFGHVTIDYRGRPCPCGSRGCLERYASATALVSTAAELLKKNKNSSLYPQKGELTAQSIYREALKGDSTALSAMEDISFHLGIGISGLVNIFNPEAVIIGGGLSRAHRLILPIVKKVVREHALPGLKENIKYMAMKDQEKTTSMGAAKVGIDSSQT